MKKICLTGGGTAGHVMPNIALAEDLLKDYELIYIGSKEGMEKNLVKEELAIPYFGISTGKLKRYHAMSNFIMPFEVLKGIHEAKQILKNEKVDLVFSKGGFVAVPVVVAAHQLKIPVISHEADITPGLANKINAPYSKKVCVSFEATIKHLPKEKAVYTGLPIRRNITRGDALAAKKFLQFEENEKPNLLVIGGSSGSVFINNLIRNNLDELTKKFNVIHICGKGNKDIRIQNDSYRQYEFLKDEMKDVYALSDIIVSRAGANILYEIVALGKLNILIPLSKRASRGDQILNASSMEDAGLSFVLLEEAIENNNDVFIKAFDFIKNHEDKYRDALNKWKKFDSVKEIVKIIKKELDE